MESTGRSEILPSCMYRGRDGMPIKSSRPNKKGFFEASKIGTEECRCYQCQPTGKEKYTLDLSKSIQFGSLLSYHSEDAAVPEPPNALMFFLGVAVFNIFDKSISTRRVDGGLIRRCTGSRGTQSQTSRGITLTPTRKRQQATVLKRTSHLPLAIQLSEKEKEFSP